jgi:hypothetical protein
MVPIRLVTLWLLVGGVQAADLYVSPSGTASGPGTMEQPYDLTTALSGLAGQPGDTFWLRGGNYTLGYLATQVQGAPGNPITFRQMPGERARVDGSLNFFESSGYVILRDFELYNSDTNRASSQTGVGFNVTDIKAISGIASYSPNLSFINLIVHDQTRHGFYLGYFATNNLVYGCVIYNNGWVSPDNAEGHAFYVRGLTKEISDNIVLNNAGASMHIYDSVSGGHLSGLTLEGNVAFHAGAIQSVRSYRDWIVGVDTPALGADNIVLKANMGYYQAGSRSYEEVQIGRQGLNGSVALLNNYFPQRLLMRHWTIAAVAGNFLAAQTTGPVISLVQTQVSLAAAWNDNTYSRWTTGSDFLFNSLASGFSDWQSATGYDKHSTYNVGSLTGTRVFVRPNRYEPGRANIIVYNWDNLNTVRVDVSSVLTAGTAYELRNAQDFFAPPVLSGVFDGQPLDLPMNGLTVAAPNGPLLTAPPTGPTFNVFVLMPLGR